ncbi:amidohydrolase [Desulfarculus baarsii DSM 2075]|uniref:Amidohydrolase n=1 Tax=Desulfarculus baarsii (strain ATCC 33931 / DSM 2075 / LMG 7858 / VKM B-1802 / 2st14) TaxID=644282 RepID=E1QI29_DESB2|nr:amidohydrolase family protein [Desulfarculus baarsii]ADK85222.1 amidohydrolase [Desulfarculus baarsii DSM 2075]
MPAEGEPPAKGPICLVAAGLAGAETTADQPPAVLVRDGRVAALGHEALAAADCPRLDLPGLWLSPAPLDAHVHLLMRSTLERSLDEFHQAGVVAVRDLGVRPVDPTPGGRPDKAPLVVASGPGLGVKGPGSCWLAHKLQTPDDFAQAARRAVAAGVDLLKVFVSGLLSFEYPGQVEHPDAVGEAQLRAVTAVAREAGLTVAVHASGVAAVSRAVACGARSVEHGFFLNEPTWEAMAERGVSWLPTVAPIVTHAEDQDGRHDQATIDNLRRIAHRQMKDLPRGHALGVELVLGTDAGSYGLPHLLAVRREIDLWIEAGVPSETIFDAATSRAARLMGLGGQVGVIAKGARAWLLGLEHDPRRRPELLCRPRWRNF